MAIAATDSKEGFLALRNALQIVPDPWFRSALLSAIALTRQDEAIEFLLDLIAIEAIVRAMSSQDIAHRLEGAVNGNSRLARHPA
ncbi:MAG: hypothetical protein ACRD3B_03950 [Candidatus Sulfotelmatobacter sp.]